MGKNKQNLILPPELPPEALEEDIEVSDEALQFINENMDYAGFVSNLDALTLIQPPTDVKEDALESLYEKRLRENKKKKPNKEIEENAIEIDPVDALPVKTLDGKLYYRTVPRRLRSVVNLTKAEKRAKLKKLRKESKKQAKEEVQQSSQAKVLDEVKNDITAEEANESKKYKLAELGIALLADPESNIKSLREMLEISKEGNGEIFAGFFQRHHSRVIMLIWKNLLSFNDISSFLSSCLSGPTTELRSGWLRWWVLEEMVIRRWVLGTIELGNGELGRLWSNDA
ncbi:Hypothetical predicted protein [Olea europaea subsp. europaea]|uniref:Uncharacterized protein n=1 Tax=Olea europaea subsp. europaea TaxID=158383 RepID=A0A8S0SMP5_OLEEU|nr:Hypothetical predicted protein [Olea europaea subsp. europaea]